MGQAGFTELRDGLRENHFRPALMAGQKVITRPWRWHPQSAASGRWLIILSILLILSKFLHYSMKRVTHDQAKDICWLWA